VARQIVRPPIRLATVRALVARCVGNVHDLNMLLEVVHVAEPLVTHGALVWLAAAGLGEK